MYVEFIIIYIILGLILILNIAVVILLIKVLKKLNSRSGRALVPQNYGGGQNAYQQTPVVNGNTVSLGTVFCKNCGAQFDGIHKICPKCGTPR